MDRRKTIEAIIRAAPRHRTAGAIAAVGALGLLGGIALAGGVISEGSANDNALQPTAAEERAVETNPEPLTDFQCATAASMVKIAGASFRKVLEESSETEALQLFDREQAAAESWVASGCPPDPVRGYYPAADGSGGALRLYERQGFSGSTSSGQGAIILQPR
jgi:hypothetical protein